MAAASSSPAAGTGLTALVLGASGNVGGALVRRLLAPGSRWGSVILVNRRALPEWSGDARVKEHVLDINRLETEVAPALAVPPDACFVTLGVGAPSKLPSGEEGKKELMRVDCEVPYALARAAKLAGVPHFALLTATGANVAGQYSWLTHTSAVGGFYRHVKGTAEQRVQALGFRTCGIFRPGALLGNANTPSYVGWLAPKMDLLLPANAQSIHIDEVAEAMVRQAEQALDAGKPEVTVAEGKSLFALCR